MSSRYRSRRHRRRSYRNSNADLPLLILFIIAGVYYLDSKQAGSQNNGYLVTFAVTAALLVTAIVLLAALWKYRSDRRKLHALDIAAIDTMDPLEFEKYVATLLKNEGFTNIRLTERYDLGVDIIASKDGITWGVQVKRYSHIVKAEAVRQVFTALTRYKCDRAMVVTNNTFSRPARALASDNNCLLIGRDELAQWIVHFQKIDT